MSLVRWNPIRELQEMNNAMDRFFDDPLTRRFFREEREHLWRMPMDAYMTEDAIVIKMELPGVNKDDVNITLENGVLTISGEMRPREESREYSVQERFHGRFERVLSIGSPVNISKAEAVFENGVLTLTLPKTEEVKPRKIAIKSK